MGDIIHGLPAAALLKDRLPDLELSWLLEPAGIPLVEGNPVIDRVIVFPRRKWLQQLNSVSGALATASEASAFVDQLRKLKFDAVLDLQGLLKSAVLGFLSGANLRFGFKGTREGADRLLSHALDVGNYFGPDAHVVDLNLRLAEFACRELLQESHGKGAAEKSHSYIYRSPRFPLPAPPAETVQSAGVMLRSDRNRLPSPLIAFIPGTTWESKIWPAEKWIELAGLCLARYEGPLVLLGGPAETEMNAAIASAHPGRILDLTGRTEIKDLLAIFQMTDIVVGADSGPTHLAAATGKGHVVAVFGATPPGRNGPYGEHCMSVNLGLGCQPCFKRVCPLGTLACLRDLNAEPVFEKIVGLTQGEPGVGS